MNMSAFEMTTMANSTGMPMHMGQSMGWTVAYAILVVMMWWIMMIAMMTHSVAPTLLLFAALKRHGKDKQNTALHSGLLPAGYLLVWTIFSGIATFLQWWLETLGLISTAMMAINSKLFVGTIFYVLTYTSFQV